MNNGTGTGSVIKVTSLGNAAGGAVLRIGKLLWGVLAAAVATGDLAALRQAGSQRSAKKNDFEVAVGDPLYWSEANSRFEDDPSLPCLGIAIDSAEETDTTAHWVLTTPKLQGTAYRKHKLAGAAARPAAGDDVGDGFEVGSLWLYQGITWMCTDATLTAAKWRPLNPLVTTATVASGQTSVSVDITGLPGIANGDYVHATVRTKGANACYVVEAKVAGGNLVLTVNTDPGTGGAVCSVTVWPVPV